MYMLKKIFCSLKHTTGLNLFQNNTASLALAYSCTYPVCRMTIDWRVMRVSQMFSRDPGLVCLGGGFTLDRSGKPNFVKLSGNKTNDLLISTNPDVSNSRAAKMSSSVTTSSLFPGVTGLVAGVKPSCLWAKAAYTLNKSASRSKTLRHAAQFSRGSQDFNQQPSDH